MTGPFHYKEAERLLTRDRVERHDDIDYVIRVPSDRDLVEAQVHATLALAAASASGLKTVGISDDMAAAWFEAVDDV